VGNEMLVPLTRGRERKDIFLPLSGVRQKKSLFRVERLFIVCSFV
jgi:hypothetical protein